MVARSWLRPHPNNLSSIVYADSLLAILRRNRLAIGLVTLAALVISLAWALLNPPDYIGRAQVLVSLRVPEGAQAPAYEVEISRTVAIDYLMDDLEQLVIGSSFARLASDRLGSEYDIPLDANSFGELLSAERTHRGLTFYARAHDQRTARLAAQVAAEALGSDAHLLLPAIADIAHLAVIDLDSRLDLEAALAEAIAVGLVTAIAFLGSLLFAIVGAARRDRLYLDRFPDHGELPLLARLDIA